MLEEFSMNREIVGESRRDYYRISIRHQQRKTFPDRRGKTLSLSLSLSLPCFFFPTALTHTYGSSSPTESAHRHYYTMSLEVRR